MKRLLIPSLLVCAAYGFSFLNLFSDPVEVVPTNVCAGQPTGTKFPNDTDCNRFILCDSGYSMSLACRTTEPHFDKCTGTCVNDVSVCLQTSCPEESTTTTTTQAPSPDSTTSTTTTTTTQAPVTLPPTDAPTPAPQTPAPVPVTTTTFRPPTVPVYIPCTDNDVNENGCNDYVDETCGCEKQWGCHRGVCGCNTDIQCPFNDAPDGNCLIACGCEANCICLDETAKTDCTCGDPCKCIGPPDVCPFTQDQCVARCTCQNRCQCVDKFCTCNPNAAC